MRTEKRIYTYKCDANAVVNCHAEEQVEAPSDKDADAVIKQAGWRVLTPKMHTCPNCWAKQRLVK